MTSAAIITQSIDDFNGLPIILQAGELATQADASVLVRCGKAMMLATVSSKEEQEPPSFLPLFVEYQEKFAGAGKIPGGFFKREGRPAAHEILVARIVDRILRPCFPKAYRKSIQVNLVLFSTDARVLPESLAALAASAALSLSKLPFNGPISATLVGRKGKEWLVNPTPDLWEASDVQMVVGGSEERLLMIEGEMKEISEEEMIEAIKVGHAAIREQCAAQKSFQGKASPIKENFIPPAIAKDLLKTLHTIFYAPCYQIASQALPSKKKRNEAFTALLKHYLLKAADEMPEIAPKLIEEIFSDIKSQAIRNLVFATKKRMDGRGLKDIRPITIQPDFIPSAHGSALFTRGETQALSSVTLGSKLDEQMIDKAHEKSFKRLMLHYNFPGYSTGELKPQRGQSRRETGHGNLALNAIKNQLPERSTNQFTIRIDTDILAANGSSSMATICAGTLALYDAGVPLKNLVSGVAMGLLCDAKTGETLILSDILGEEDSGGDMDFKVAGTRKGITACQMDIKIASLSYELLKEALEQAKEGRLHILDTMEAVLNKPREIPKGHTPSAKELIIPAKMIGSLIGPGGKVIQQLQAESGATLNITERGKEGVVHIFAPNQSALALAKKKIESIIAIPKVGEIYTGKIQGIKDFGLFIEITPNKNGLLHISEISHERLENLEKLFKLGDEIKVKIIAEKQGKISLSRKQLLQGE